LASNTQKR
jgi:hypothetical protein